MLHGVAAVLGSNVFMKGVDSQLHIGDSCLSSCSASRASVSYLHPRTFVNYPGQTVRVHLSNVQSPCAGSPLRTPCAPSAAETNYPALYHCTWVNPSDLGNEVTVAVAQQAVSTELSSSGGTLLGFGVHVDCPVPSWSEFEALVQYDPASSGAWGITLRLHHFGPPDDADAMLIPFEGLKGGDVVKFGITAPSPPPPVPPPPHTPPSPPLPSPPSPPPSPPVTACAGATTPGSTNWVVHSASYSVYTDVSIASCGVSATPVIVASLGGVSSHWRTEGTSEIYSLTASGFRMYANIYDSTTVTPTQANSWRWHVNWLASPLVTTPSFCAGRTPRGSTNWVVHAASYSVLVDVSLASCGFSSTPVLVTNIGGTSSHWQANGGSAPYNIDSEGFRIYGNIDNRDDVTPSQVNAWNWHVNWMAMPVTSGGCVCAGRTPKGSTDWVVHSAGYSVYVDVDISHCGFSSTPKLVTSIGGSSSHWQADGTSAPYSISNSGFRIYSNIKDRSDITPSQANAWQWHINWIAQGC